MTDIATRAAAAQKLLWALAVADMHAVICGGYARDTICQKPIRDVDLYVKRSDYQKAFDFLFPAGATLAHENQDTPEYLHQSIALQQENDLKTELKTEYGLEVSCINLIGLNDAMQPEFSEVVRKFNLGICQAGIDIHHGIQITDAFRADFKDKQITLLRTDWGHEATLKQFIKLQAKYPWPLRVKAVEAL